MRGDDEENGPQEPLCYLEARALILLTEATPFRLSVLSAEAEARTVIHRFSSGMKIFFFFKLGSHRRRVDFLECEIEFPALGPTPVNWQRFDMEKLLN